MEKVLLCEIQERIAILEINRPPYNPLSPTVIHGLTKVLEDIYSEESVHVVVIKGAGEKSFSAGADIRHFTSRLGSKDLALAGDFHKAYDLLNQLPLPVIAALKGRVLGGGLELALACDFRLCDENTKLALPEVNLGIIPGAGGTQRLPRLIGAAKAMEMMMFGRSVSAAEALNLGLVNRVVPPGTVEEEALNWAKILKQKPKLSLKNIKKSVHYGLGLPLAEGIRYEKELFSEMFISEDAKEGVNAFLEKRSPVFNGK